jgi:hypothetical protein
MRAREDRSRSRQSIHRIWYINVSSVLVLRGELSPTTANHDFKTAKMASLYRELTLVSTRCSEPAGMNARAVALFWSARRGCACLLPQESCFGKGVTEDAVERQLQPTRR